MALVDALLPEFDHEMTVTRKLLERVSPPLSRESFTAATIGHAARFTTWQSLDEAGLSDDAKADLVTEWLK